MYCRINPIKPIIYIKYYTKYVDIIKYRYSE